MSGQRQRSLFVPKIRTYPNGLPHGLVKHRKASYVACMARLYQANPRYVGPATAKCVSFAEGYLFATAV